jgi:hypothetical protein
VDDAHKPFEMFIGERSADIEVHAERGGGHIGLSVGTEWFPLDVRQAIDLSMALTEAALRIDRIGAFKAVLDR